MGSHIFTSFQRILMKLRIFTNFDMTIKLIYGGGFFDEEKAEERDVVKKVHNLVITESQDKSSLKRSVFSEIRET